MTRKEREALEDRIVEDQLARLNAECDAEVAARYSNHGVVSGSMDFAGPVTGRFSCAKPNLSRIAAVQLPKSHPARFLALYGSRPADMLKPYVRLDIQACRLMLWAFGHPFGADLVACVETNS